MLGWIVKMFVRWLQLVGLGGLILISGFIGFNIGSLGRVSGQGAQLGLVTENTVMGGAGAAVMAMLLCRTGVVGEPKWAFAITLNAAIAGIVSHHFSYFRPKQLFIRLHYAFIKCRIFSFQCCATISWKEALTVLSDSMIKSSLV